MKKTLSTLAIICSLTAFGQTSQEHLQNGIAKHKQQDFKGAIKDYDKSIKEDKANKDAYYNRGTCELALKDFKSAMTDFSKTIELAPKFVKAYYSRATVFVSQEKYADALPDLDKTIELDPTIPNALTLRGQIRAQTGNKKGACEDFNQAKQIGDQVAETYISKYCNRKEINTESLSLKWPDNEKWKMEPPQENDKMKLTELLRNGETFDNWTEIGTMLVYKGVTGEDVESRAKSLYEQTRPKCPAAKFTMVEMDKKIEYPWIIFSIECPISGQTKTPESQLWYIVQGNLSMYFADRAIKEESLPADLKLKWTEFFKTGKIINQ